MQLSETERSFLGRRTRLVRTWPWVGGGLLAGWAALSGWLLLTRPRLVIPTVVWAELADGSLPAATLELMAAMLPVAVSTGLGLTLVAILFAWVSMANERRYLDLLRRLTPPPARPEPLTGTGDAGDG